MRAVIYCRVSTKDQVDNHSLPTQKKFCKKYCQDNGWDVDRIFLEEGASAKTANRPAIKELMEHCRNNKGKIQFLIVYSLSRFARATLDHTTLRAYFGSLGITLRSATESIDDTATGRMMEGVLATMAQYDNDLRADRTKAGMTTALEKGNWTFGAPLGFLISPGQNSVPSLIHDPERVHLVRDAFILYSKGSHTKQDVLRRMIALGLRTKKGKPISSQTLNNILKNPLYKGWISVPKMGIDNSGNFEPIIDEATFDRVQALLSGRRSSNTPRQRNHPDYPLRHFVRCAHCDVPLTGSKSKGTKDYYSYYHCRNKSCGQVRIRKEVMEKQFLDLLSTLKPRQKYVELFKAIVMDVWTKKQSEAVQNRKALEKRHTTLLEKKDQLIEAYVLDKVMKNDDFARIQDKFNEEIAIVRLEIHDATLEEYDVESVLAFADQVLLDAPRLWAEYDLDQKQRFQNLVFPKGLKHDGDSYRIAATCGLYTYLREFDVEKVNLASPTGIEPVLPP